LLGTLALKDGTELLIGVSNSDQRFHGYVQMLKDLWADEQRMKNILGEDL
jgi:hypothetical protein